MKTQFKFLIVLIFVSTVLNAQKFDVYKNSFDATNISTLSLDVESSSVVIEASEDEQIHINYSIEFNNYSKKELQKIIDSITVSTVLEKDVLKLICDSKNAHGGTVYTVETLFGITFEGDLVKFGDISNRHFRKSKQYFYGINNTSEGKVLKEYLKNIRQFDGKKKKKKVKAKNIKSFKTSFVIKMPTHLNFSAVALNSRITSTIDLKSQITVKARNTRLYFKELSNQLNSFNVVNGEFNANTLTGGNYKFNHVEKVLVAELNQLKIDGEFTDFRIGLIGQGVEIVDFNSKFWLHNFIRDFENFKMHTEYSEVNLFFPEDMEFQIETFGHNTVHYTDNLVTEIPPSSTNESSKMMVIGKDTATNRIKINTRHGIVRFGKDFIDIED